MSRLSLDTCTLRGNAASYGGGLFAAGGSVVVDSARLDTNTATGGGAAVLSGASMLSANSTRLDLNAAAFAGALMLLDGSSAVLSSSTASRNFASRAGGAFFLAASAALTPRNLTISENRCAGGGGVVFAQGSSPAALGLASLATVANNSADNWGSFAATDNFFLEVSVPPVVITGTPLPATVTIRDGFSQTVNGLSQSSVVVTCPEAPTALTAPFVNAADSNVSAVTGLAVSGPPGRSFRLQFVVTSKDLPAPLTQSVNVTISPCGPLEVRRRGPRGVGRWPPPATGPTPPSDFRTREGRPGRSPCVTGQRANFSCACGVSERDPRIRSVSSQVVSSASGQCSCVEGSERSSVTGKCVCSDGFYSFTSTAKSSSGERVSTCEACPSVGAVCSKGLLVPSDGYWHSSPESADVQQCTLARACTQGKLNQRSAALLALQRSILQSNNFSRSLTNLALAGLLDLDAYREAQCAEGCAGRFAAAARWRHCAIQSAINKCASSLGKSLIVPAPSNGLFRYTGPLCSRCAPSYGRVKLVECARCMPEDANTGHYSGIIIANVVAVGILSASGATIEQSLGRHSALVAIVGDSSQSLTNTSLSPLRSPLEPPRPVRRPCRPKIRADNKGESLDSRT